MKQNKFPQNWDDKRVQQVIGHYETQTEDEATDEDETVFGDAASQTVRTYAVERSKQTPETVAQHAGPVEPGVLRNSLGIFGDSSPLDTVTNRFSSVFEGDFAYARAICDKKA